MNRLRAWLASWIADDPHPQYSALDNLDGRNELASR